MVTRGHRRWRFLGTPHQKWRFLAGKINELNGIWCSIPLPLFQQEFQDRKMEVLYHKKPYSDSWNGTFFYLYVRDGFIPNNLMSNFALCPSVFLVPHIFAWSFFFLLCTPVHFSSSPPLFHTQPRTHTHNSVTNNSVTHNSVCKYWKKLKCEVIWSFNFSFGFYVSQWWHMVPSQPPHFSDRDTIHGDDVEATNKHGDLPTRRALPSKDTFSGNFRQFSYNTYIN